MSIHATYPANSIEITDRARFKGEAGAWTPGLPPTEASHQTLHIFFVRDMCVRDCV